MESVLHIIAERAKNAQPIAGSILFQLGDESVHVDGSGTENIVSAENKPADCTITISPADFQSLIQGKLDPMMAFMMGKVKIKGDMGIAMRLKSLLG